MWNNQEIALALVLLFTADCHVALAGDPIFNTNCSNPPVLTATDQGRKIV
jgi:hypothetical protein